LTVRWPIHHRIGKNTTMPLTSVVDYYNVRLPELHPQARLAQGASYRLDRGLLTAQVAGFLLTPYLVPVVHAVTGQWVGQRAKLLVRAANGNPASNESLYAEVWEAADVIFLDRFLRTLHALNHLHQDHDGHGLLVLDVHPRHVAALPDHHGEVFEGLLQRFGLRTDRVVLRLDGRALHNDPHVQMAARSFVGHGYRLLAARPDVDHTDWDLLRDLGVRWVSPNIQALETLHRRGALGQWVRQSSVARLWLWLDGVDTPLALAQARTLGADLIEGDLGTRLARPEPLRYPLTAWAVAG
jgi:EAL domain-containing protein (putative c-di-GMP-specific phosphodiesterase class I)